MAIGPDFDDLMMAARDGDRLALAAVIRAAQPEIRRMASHLVDPAEADDVTQEVFVRMWRALARFRGDSSARTWLLSIARRTCADRVRHRTRVRRLIERFSNTVIDLSHEPHGMTEIDELIDSLPRDRREAFILTQLIGCSYEETAAVCGVPIGTIRSRVARARADLLDAWHDAEGNDDATRPSNG